MTTKAQLAEMDAAVLEGMQEKRHHGRVKAIRYAANRVVTGERYSNTPYTEAQVRSSLKRLEAADKVENPGWNRANWTVITDEMRVAREAARKERETRLARAEAIQKALGLGAFSKQVMWKDEHVKTRKNGKLLLSSAAVEALAAALGVE